MAITKVSPALLDLDSGITITTADNTAQLQLISTDTDAGSGPQLDLYRNSGSPADGDDLGRIYFYGENDADQKIEMVLMRASIVDASDSSEDSSFQLYTYVGGSQADRLTINSTETVFNESSKDVDFRIESDGLTNAFVIDGGNNGVGFGTTPRSDLHTTWEQLFIGEKGSIISERLGTGGIYGTLITDNLYVDSDTGSYANITTDESSLYMQEAGVHKFFSQASGSAGAAVTLAEKVRITTDGIALGTNKYFGDVADTDNYLQFNQANTFRFVTGDTTSISGTPTELVFNEDSANMDIRFETDDNANMMTIDAGSNVVRIGSGTGYVSSCLQVAQMPGAERHQISLTSGTDSTISGSGQSAKYAEGVVACTTTSAGNTISIPVYSQANLWRQYQIELMVCSAEYNSSTADERGGTAKFGLTSLNSLSIANVAVTGNISGVTVNSMNVLVEFSTAFTDGLNNYEGAIMYYKVLGLTPEYFEGWAATLD